MISPKNISTEQNAAKEPLTRLKFISVAALSGAGLAALKPHEIEEHAMADGNRMAEEIKKEKIRRAMLADPFDTTSPPIPIGPHWMILWLFFDAKAAGLSTVMRDARTMVMFARTPYTHLHICGSLWEGNEYHRSDRGVWTMRYERP